MLNENVLKVLEKSMWDLATSADGEPNVESVHIKLLQFDNKYVIINA